MQSRLFKANRQKRFVAKGAVILVYALYAGCGNVTTATPDGGDVERDGSTGDDASARLDAEVDKTDASLACDDGWAGPNCEDCVTYVHADSGNDDGSGRSWSDPVLSIQTAIEVAQSRLDEDDVETCDVWVRQGVYLPGTARTNSFELASGVHLYGGFTGDERLRDGRDFEANETILSGDLNRNDDPDDETTLDDNAYTVVLGADDAVLDGFTITGGYANGEGFDELGGGLDNVDASPLLQHITFTDNRAGRNGGAMHNRGTSAPEIRDTIFRGNLAESNAGAVINTDQSAPIFVDVTFRENSAAGSGGAVLNSGDSKPTYTNVVFVGNTADTRGGGVSNSSGSEPVLTNVILIGNQSALDGGAMSNGLSTAPILTNVSFFGNESDERGGAISTVGTNMSIAIRNSIFWGNTAPEDSEISPSNTEDVVISHSVVEGGRPPDVAEENFIESSDNNPLFRDADNGDLRPLSNSPAIDAGNSFLGEIPDHDLDGNPRIVDGTGDGESAIDIGAYEYQPSAGLANAQRGLGQYGR